ncbi:MAG: hypothetical protein MUO88_13160, partial [Desulfobacterales bacterium]|nr:hypothetical protein [Desulfobacterales bacterium]
FTTQYNTVFYDSVMLRQYGVLGSFRRLSILGAKFKVSKLHQHNANKGHKVTKILSETFAKPPFLPNFYACPVKCEAYFSGVRLKF